MRHLFLIFWVCIASSAFGWQPIEIEEDSSSIGVPLFASFDGPGATSWQVVNTGTENLTVSAWRYRTSWSCIFPRAAKTVSEAFYAISDSVYTIPSGGSIFIDKVADSQGVHLLYIKRPDGDTSALVVYQ